MADPDSERELSGLLPLVDTRVRARVRGELTATKSRRSSRDRRRKFLESLYHHPAFDGRYVTVLPYEQTRPEGVRAELVARGAPKECYVITNDSRYDGTTMQLDEALDQLGDGTILLCIPGRLAYYYGEESVGGGYQWIVERRN